MDPLRTQVAVVGAGAAGLYTALCAARNGAEVTLVSATPLAESSTWWAQGGLAAAVSPEDSPELHLADTVEERMRTVLVECFVTIDEIAPQMVVIDGKSLAEKRCDKLDFGREVNAVFGREIVEGLFTEPIARQCQPAAGLVIQRKCPHAFTGVEDTPTKPADRRQQHFGIGAGFQHHTGRFKFLATLQKIVDFAVQ